MADPQQSISEAVDEPQPHKTCVTCGADLKGKRRRKDRQGQYYCPSCYKRSPRRCACCGAEVARQDCHRNRHGEYICHACRESGRTFYPGAIFKRRLRWLAWVIAYLVGGALVILACWSIVDLVIGFFRSRGS